VNPTTGEILETLVETTPAEIDRILDDDEGAVASWRHAPFAHRAERMRGAAAILRTRKGEYARTMALEMGKPIAEGEAEAEKCAWVCEYYAEHAEAFLREQPRDTDAAVSYVRFDPLGTVLAIMPWNFPFWQVFRFAAPALMAGNAGLLKHASNVPRCALEIEDVFRGAGFPPGLFRSVLVPSAAVGPIVADRRVRAVTLTGSDHAGSKVAEQAGRELKKTVLELGGSDPFILLEDADVRRAARVAADSRLINGGQSCIAAKRFIVVEGWPGVHRRVRRPDAHPPGGDPLARDTQVGPRPTRTAPTSTARWWSREGGARVASGEIPVRGAFYPPGPRADKGMPVVDEAFGPVAAVIRARDEMTPSAANDSIFGLGASLWTEDRARARRLAGEIEAGGVFVNGP
jgi:succinate-semialdehyde dehydrogenase/glutarate-semialdehyde dehydrogenase